MYFPYESRAGRRAGMQPLTPPPGIVTVNIDRSTGQLASGGNSREEYFTKAFADNVNKGGTGELPLLIR